MQKKPQLSFVKIWNMSFGFLVIQFGWGLQLANMSPIYEGETGHNWTAWRDRLADSFIAFGK